MWIDVRRTTPCTLLESAKAESTWKSGVCSPIFWALAELEVDLLTSSPPDDSSYAAEAAVTFFVIRSAKKSPRIDRPPTWLSDT